MSPNKISRKLFGPLFPLHVGQLAAGLVRPLLIAAVVCLAQWGGLAAARSASAHWPSLRTAVYVLRVVLDHPIDAVPLRAMF